MKSLPISTSSPSSSTRRCRLKARTSSSTSRKSTARPVSAENIRERGAELGFVFKQGERRIFNTFDAHRLLHWAELEGKQHALKEALFTAYFSQHANVSSHEVLADVAQKVGLDRVRAEAVLSNDQYASEVRELEQLWVSRGVSSVPTIVFNDQYAVSGGQPVDVFVSAIRQIIGDESSVVDPV
jgi:predicted DsbA family dithiol-disulfide isomerase